MEIGATVMAGIGDRANISSFCSPESGPYWSHRQKRKLRIRIQERMWIKV